MNNNPFTRTFTLVQHSPLIHFQHQQAGATLRATELKPKLDRFLIAQLGGKEAVKKDFKSLLVSNGKNQHLSFDYKLKVTPLGKKPKEFEFVIIGNPKDSEADRDTALLFEEGLMLSFSSLKPDILQLIDEYLKPFLLLTNFGKRGSKGLGSFSLKGTSISEAEACFKKYSKAVFKKGHSLNMPFNQDTYNIVTKDNQLLKSGFNFNGYQKAKLFEYAMDQSLRWDKRKIKRAIHQQSHFKEKLYAQRYAPIDIDGSNSWEDHSPEEYRFFRAMLGLPELYEFLVEFNGRADKKNKYVVKIKHKGKFIDRFKSPILFKVINRSLYVLALDIPDKYFGQEFDFELHTKLNQNPIYLDTIQTPSKGEFNLVDFLKKYLPTLKYKQL